MATLWELFKGESRYLKVDGEIGFKSKTDGAVVGTVYLQVSFAFDEYFCFLSYFVPENMAAENSLLLLIDRHMQSIDEIRGSIETATSHEAYEPGISSNEVPFTGRVFLYVDAQLDDNVRELVIAHGQAQGVRVQIRDRRYEAFLNEHEVPRSFISHDSRDKPYVEVLANRLRAALCPVWYDAFSLKPGDSLRESIDEGLRVSKKCVVFLSPNFFANPGWGKKEFNAAMNKHINSGDVLIPVWHGVTREEVAEYSLLVSDIVAINTDVGEDEVFNQLYRALMTEPPDQGESTITLT